MKKTVILAMALSFMASMVQANVLVFHGKITVVTPNPNPLYKVGDDVMIVVHHSPIGVVTRETIAVNESMINLARTNPGSNVFVDTDTSDGFVGWTVYDSGTLTNLHVDVEAQTENGVIPCITDFFTRGFNFTEGGTTVQGDVTAVPTERTGN